MLAKLEKLTLELAIIGHFTSYCSLWMKKSGFPLVWGGLIDYLNVITVS